MIWTPPHPHPCLQFYWPSAELDVPSDNCLHYYAFYIMQCGMFLYHCAITHSPITGQVVIPFHCTVVPIITWWWFVVPT